MKHIAIYCVNYHSYDSLEKYLLSIDRAAQKSQEPLTLSVFVADNTVPCVPVSYEPQHFSLRVLPTGENKGYFGAVHYLMRLMSPLEYDYCIVSNVDVLLDSTFFTNLCTWKPDETVGWIAPEIYSKSLGFDFNPQAVVRYSLTKMRILRLLFKYPWMLRMKQKLLHVYKNIESIPSGPIYAGHGSFIILTKLYFSQCGIINYPIFLYGEEIYLAETCRQHHIQIIYEPKIKVIDIGRVSTGNIPFRQYCKYNFQAISHILNTYY